MSARGLAALTALALISPVSALADDFVVRSLVREGDRVRAQIDVDTTPLLQRVRAIAPAAVSGSLPGGVQPSIGAIVIMFGTGPKSIRFRVDWRLQLPPTKVSIGFIPVLVEIPAVVLSGDATGHIDLSVTVQSSGHAAAFLDTATISGKGSIPLHALSVGAQDIPLKTDGAVAELKVLDFKVLDVRSPTVTIEAVLDVPEPELPPEEPDE